MRFNSLGELYGYGASSFGFIVLNLGSSVVPTFSLAGQVIDMGPAVDEALFQGDHALCVFPQEWQIFNISDSMFVNNPAIQHPYDASPFCKLLEHKIKYFETNFSTLAATRTTGVISSNQTLLYFAGQTGIEAWSRDANDWMYGRTFLSEFNYTFEYARKGYLSHNDTLLWIVGGLSCLQVFDISDPFNITHFSSYNGKYSSSPFLKTRKLTTQLFLSLRM
jgi:hypothetical protein